MLQDIGSSKLDINYYDRKPDTSDVVICFDSEERVMVSEKSMSQDNRLIFPNINKVNDVEKVTFLFTVDETPYYLLLSEEKKNVTGFSYQDFRRLRGVVRNLDLFIVFTAYHLWRWYMDNRICGRCGNRLIRKNDERALTCKDCKNTVYPRINPAVIVGVINDDKILITRYRTGYAHNALVAGFTEIGETLEQTVAREVMEETGVKVKNTRYYKSQPWGMAQDILVGFFCEVDGDSEIHMDENELKYAEWVTRDDLELQPSDISLTNEMMKVFKFDVNNEILAKFNDL